MTDRAVSPATREAIDALAARTLADGRLSFRFGPPPYAPAITVRAPSGRAWVVQVSTSTGMTGPLLARLSAMPTDDALHWSLAWMDAASVVLHGLRDD